MFFVYSILLALGVVLLLPRFLLDALRHGKYVTGLSERLGSVATLDTKGGPIVWLHCVSVGEAQAARPLVRAIRARFPNHAIVVSTVTAAGQTLAQEIFKDDAVRVFYFPIDWRCTVRRTLRAINPSVVLLMETEIWPRLLRECRLQGIRVAIVNGRLSERSFRRYKMISSFVARVVDCLDLAVMQSESDADRMRALGLDPSRVVISGNIKFDAQTGSESESLRRELAERFALTDGPLIMAASTHDPEEQIILNCFTQVRRECPSQKPRLVIAPRHPERFAEVASLIARSGLAWSRRSDPASEIDRASDVILLDSIGELTAIFPLASIVFVGGSIANAGGHNILEPAAAGSCIIVGAHTDNFREIVTAFVAAQAIIQLSEVSENELIPTLTKVINELLNDAARRHELGTCAKALVEANRGATERTMQFLDNILSETANASASPPLPLQKVVATR